MENSALDIRQDAMRGAPVEGGAADNAADSGRGTDSVLAHMSLGEIVIPRAFQDDPDVMQMLQALFEHAGANINQYTVGHQENSINPETGYPEFGFFKSLRKIASIALPIAASYFAPGIGTALGSTLGASTLGGIGGAIGGAGGGLLSGGGAKAALKGAALGGAGGYLSNGGASELIGGTAAGNTLGLSNPEGGSIIGNAIGSSDAGGSALTGNGLGGLFSGSTFGTSAGSPLANGVGPTQGTGLLGASGRIASNIGSSIGGLSSGASGGGSSYGGIGGLGLAANLVGGYNQDEALKKQKEQLLGANNQQLANLETFDPSNITNDAGYQFNLEQGQKGLNQQLAAGGGLFSGQALKAASEYNQNYANNALKDAYSRWSNKTGAQNALYGSGGQIAANTTGGQANNISQTMASALGTNVNGYGTSQDELLKKLLLKQA